MHIRDNPPPGGQAGRAAEPRLCVLAIQTATGAVGMFVTAHPDASVEHLGLQLEVARRHAVESAHAERVASELREVFREHAIATWGRGLWFLVPWDEVTAALADFDPATGRRRRLEDLGLGDRVQVEITTADNALARRQGVISSISGRRYLVELLDPVGDLIGVWAPRNLLKPVGRLCVLSGGAA